MTIKKIYFVYDAVPFCVLQTEDGTGTLEEQIDVNEIFKYIEILQQQLGSQLVSAIKTTYTQNNKEFPCILWSNGNDGGLLSMDFQVNGVAFDATNALLPAPGEHYSSYDLDTVVGITGQRQMKITFKLPTNPNAPATSDLLEDNYDILSIQQIIQIISANIVGAFYEVEAFVTLGGQIDFLSRYPMMFTNSTGNANLGINQDTSLAATNLNRLNDTDTQDFILQGATPNGKALTLHTLDEAPDANQYKLQFCDGSIETIRATLNNQDVNADINYPDPAIVGDYNLVIITVDA